MPTLAERFHGALLGLAVGDALGARFEAQTAPWIQSRFPTPQGLFDNPPHNELWYTDDTQMAIGVAETLAEHGEIIEENLCRAFVANYVPSRGYGRGARVVLEAMEDGKDYRRIAEQAFPGGSYGNGAAMRVAPIGLVFRDDHDSVWEQARRSAIPTHTHPLGIEGAQILALAVALSSRAERIVREDFFAELLQRATTEDYQNRMKASARATSIEELATLGNGIEAINSVPTAIACFATFHESYLETVGRAILLGGDTDTIAAMAGAISGAFLGVQAIPARVLSMLEDREKGRSYIGELADRLHARYLGR